MFKHTYSKSVLTKGRSGKLEVRSLVSRGQYILCEYLDTQTSKLADKKTQAVVNAH